MKKRALSALLALCMALSLLPWAAVPARAEDTTQRKTFMLGASGIATGDTVYFGQQGSTNSDRYWRVLSPADEAKRILLLSIQTKGTTTFGTNNTWAGSAAQDWCKRFFNGSSFNDMDRAAIAETSVTDDDSTLYNGHTYGPASLNKEHVFFLSAKEAKLVTYSDKQADGGVAWWLRSPIANGAGAGIVDGAKNVISMAVGETIGARPACNLNADSILFTQVARKSTAAAGTMQRIDSIDNDATVWKLTLHDSDRDGFRAEIAASSVNLYGGTVTIAYSGATTGGNEHVSVLLCDKTGAALCYGVSAPLTNANQSSGTVTFTVPKLTGLEAKRYKLYVFNEQRNDQKTDAYYPEYYNSYASALQETELPVIGFGSGDSSVQNNTVRYSVHGAPRNALLIAARYDGGKMTDVQTLDLAGAEEKEGTLTLRGTGTGFKLFLVDKTTYAPLCPAFDRMSTSS